MDFIFYKLKKLKTHDFFLQVCWNNNDNGNLSQLQQPLNQARVASYESINKINIEIQSTGGMHESK